MGREGSGAHSFLGCAPQNFLRCQNNKTNYNLVCETLQFLDIMCGSTTGGLGLLGLYINEYNVALITQTLETLTEYCQGPCHENQVWALFPNLITDQGRFWGKQGQVLWVQSVSRSRMWAAEVTEFLHTSLAAKCGAADGG